MNNETHKDEQVSYAATGQILSYEESLELMYGNSWMAYLVMGEGSKFNDKVGQLTLTSEGKSSEFKGHASFSYENDELSWGLAENFSEPLSGKDAIENIVPNELLEKCLAAFRNYS